MAGWSTNRRSAEAGGAAAAEGDGGSCREPKAGLLAASTRGEPGGDPASSSPLSSRFSSAVTPAMAARPSRWEPSTTRPVRASQPRREPLQRSKRHRHQPTSTCSAATRPAPPRAATPARAGSPGRAELPSPIQKRGPRASNTSASPQTQAAATAVAGCAAFPRRTRVSQPSTSSPPARPQAPHNARQSGKLSGPGTPIQSRGWSQSNQRWLTSTAAAPQSSPHQRRPSGAPAAGGSPAKAQSAARPIQIRGGNPRGGRARPARPPAATARRRWRLQARPGAG